MRSLPSLRALQAFEATARHLSVTRAAEELHVTPSAISHQLKSLESHLGIRLFHRLNRRIALTDTGRSYVQLLAAVFDRIASATDHIINGGISDVITVHCPPSFAPAWLVPRVHEFRGRHPDIDLRLHATPEPPEFFRSDTDVEIRYGPGDWPGLTVIPLMEDYITPLGTPDFRSQLSRRALPQEILALPLIHSERSPIGWADWFRHVGEEVPPLRRGLRFDRGYLSIQAAASGHGVALESLVFAEREIRTGALVPLCAFPEAFMPVGGHHLVYPPAYGDVPKVQRFRNWILEAAQESRRVSTSFVTELGSEQAPPVPTGSAQDARKRGKRRKGT